MPVSFMIDTEGRLAVPPSWPVWVIEDSQRSSMSADRNRWPRLQVSTSTYPADPSQTCVAIPVSMLWVQNEGDWWPVAPQPLPEQNRSQGVSGQNWAVCAE